jgi:ParB-like nuclease domain
MTEKTPLTAQQKTDALIRKDIDICDLVANEKNPNSMSDAEFNLLFDNFEKTGLTDPILVRALPEGKHRIVGGHHRVEVAKLHGFTKVPCTIITDPDFDEDQEKFQVVRMNMIRGKMTPEKFMKLYESLSGKYAEEVLKDAFGFAEDAEFKKMIKQIAKDLPPELQADFKKATKELKTINELSQVLNGLFTKYGSTLDYGYMMARSQCGFVLVALH